MLLPGTKCHWKNNFSQVIPLLERDYHVICVSYDGFDETENALKMGRKYEKRYLRHFENPDIIRHNYEHEELLMCYPKLWVEEIRRIVGENPKGRKSYDH